MSKYIAQIPLERIRRIAIIPAQGRSLAQVKGSADYIINGGFYDMSTGKAVGHLKADGEVLAKEEWGIWGLSWDTGADIRMTALPDGERKNYISGKELLTPSLGPDSALTWSNALGGRRGRTAMALAGEELLLYCCGDGTKDAKDPKEVRDELVALGAERAILLDGGGSSQCSFPEGGISSSRRVHNYIAVWLKTEYEDVANSQSATTEKKEKEPVGKKVVLDPGHGRETAGKCSPDKTYYEHEFALDMAGRLKTQLERHGVQVVMTRSGESDVTLADRVRTANAANADLVVSLHSNASGDGKNWTSPGGYGIYTSAAGESAGRNKAARAILSRARAAGIQIWGGGLFYNIGLYLLKNTTAPAVLIEHGFHTNINEVERLKTSAYRDLLTKVDAQGILDYLGIPWQEDAAEQPQPVPCVCPYCGKALKIEKGE